MISILALENKFIIRSLRSFLALILIVLAMLTVFTKIASAGPESTKEACDGLKEFDPSINCDLVGDPNEVAGGLVVTILNLLTFATGIICIVMIIYGGFRFITSGGDSEKTKSARNTIVYAAIGLAVVILANRIIAFVFSSTAKIS